MNIPAKRLRRIRLSLGPVEQAQIVASTAVVVAMVTVIMVSIITVGIFGFLIVFFTLKYGQLLERQNQELIALNAMAEAVNRSVEIDFLLRNGLLEVKRLTGVQLGWIYYVEGGKLVLKAPRGHAAADKAIIPPDTLADDSRYDWIFSPRIQRSPGTVKRKGKRQWPDPKIRAWASVPIMMKDTFCGVVLLASGRRNAFDARQLRLLSGFANQIGVAMENSALFEKLRRSEERYMDLFENSPDMYHIVNWEGIIVSCNRTEANRLGYRKDELVGHSILMLYPESAHEEARQHLRQMFELHQELRDVEQQMITSSGERIDVSVKTSIIYDQNVQPVYARTVARDITEKKKMEAKIIHAQRIDSIGNLAGGIAHDFNNVLTSILGSTAIMKRKMKKNDPWFRYAEIIETGAKRGASLTRQLLTFARKGQVQFRPVLVNDIVNETLSLFERSVDKTVTIEKDLSARGSIVRGDDGQLQQAILNLLINARDAMPTGGMISVYSIVKNLEAQNAQNGVERRPGKYVSVAVSDTGVGIDESIKERMFEPFFTTKEQGKGTGLGLSVVYGVVNAHEGFITVESTPGQGATFTMYFPIMKDSDISHTRVSSTRLRSGNESILVVDDEEQVSEVIQGMLRNLGYRVTVVGSGKEAIASVRAKKKFSAVILDMNMPSMGGKDTFFNLKELDPDLRIIISTGYSDTSIESSPLKNSIDGFLQKPYQLEELSKILREVLGKRKSPTV
jgi:PAS domain S-box-containing protein